MDISVDTNDLIPTFQTLKNISAQIPSKSKLSDYMEVVEKPILREKSHISLPIKTNRNGHLHQFLKANHSYDNCIINKSIISDEDIFLKILNKYKIRIPNYDNLIKKQKKYKKAKVNGINKKRKSNSSKRFSCRKRSRTKYCSHFATKLLILNLYLRYLEKERYTKHLSNI